LFFESIAYKLIEGGFRSSRAIKLTYIISISLQLIVLILSWLLMAICGLFALCFAIAYLCIHSTVLFKYKMSHLRFSTTDKKWLYDVLDEVKRSAGYIKNIEMKVVETVIPESFSGGRVIIVSNALLNIFSKDEVKATLAHELGHIVYLDSIHTCILQKLLHFCVLFNCFNCLCLFYNIIITMINVALNSVNIIMLILIIIALLSNIVGIIGYLSFSRIQEHLADMYSVKVTGSNAIVGALEKLEKEAKPPLWRSLLHPPTKARIYVVEQYYQEISKSMHKHS
jgi:heat shock protein HtpX